MAPHPPDSPTRPATRWNLQTFMVPAILVALWCVLLLVLYQWNARNEAAHVRELALLQARAFFSQIVSTRAWNAAHGGVFVHTSELGAPNPWLPPGERTMLAADGTQLTRINPAYMTRQISEFLTTSQGVSFRITSLNPLRPENSADPWEARSLQTFGQGNQENFTLVEEPLHDRPRSPATGQVANEPHGPYFRYMAPLVADRSCLGCHRTADDTVGGLRGGISVSIAATPLLTLERQRMGQMGLAYAIIGMVGLLGIGGASLQVSRRKALAEAANRMKSAFLANMSHDMRTPLTGIIGMAELLSTFRPSPAGHDGGTTQATAGAGQATAGAAHRAPTDAAPHVPAISPAEAREQSPGNPPAADVTARRYSDYLGQLHCAAANLLEIVNDITDFSCLESGRMRLSPRVFRLRSSLEACLGVYRFAGERKGLAMSLHVATSVPDVLTGDDFRLRQALGNLIGNAVKFTSAGGVAVVVNRLPEPARQRPSGRPGDAEDRRVLLRFTVVDTGIGIPQEQQASIFDSFVQGEAASSLCVGGTGLGLAISREIARMMDGDIGVSSTPGKGSEFWLTARFREPGQQELPPPVTKRTPCGAPPLAGAGEAAAPQHAMLQHACRERENMPASEAADSVTCRDGTGTHVPQRQGGPFMPQGPDGPYIPQSPPAAAASLRVLVADDNPVNRLFMQDVLRNAGHHVDVAEDGQRALRLLEELRPDMALLDVRMPGCDGTEVVRRLRAGMVPGVPVNLPVLAVTASAVGAEGAALIRAGMTGCVCKPMTATQLLAAVQDAATGGAPLECPGVGHEAPPPPSPPQGADAPVDNREALDATPSIVRTITRTDATPAPPTAPADPMNEVEALDALGGNHTLLVKLCSAFLGEVDTRREALALAVREHRHHDARLEAHALKNSAGMLRLDTLHQLSDALEHTAALFADRVATGSGLAEQLTRLLPELDRAVERVRAVASAEATPIRPGHDALRAADTPQDRNAPDTEDAASPGTVPGKEAHR